MTMQAPTASGAVERVLRALVQRRDACIEQVVGEAERAIDGYAGLDQGQTTDFAETVRKGFEAILLAIAEQRSFNDEDVAFLWPHIRRRTEAGVAEGDMMAVVRIFQRVLWDAIVELAGEDEEGRAAALIFARPLIDYIDVLSDTVNKAFVEAEEAIASNASGARSELLELLLSGLPPAPGPALNAARAAGLTASGQLLVIVARHPPPAIDQTALRVAALALAGAGWNHTGLAVVRGSEIVVIRPTLEQEAESVARALQAAHARLNERGISLAIGISTVHERMTDIPAAYAEACQALEHVRESGGVLSLSGLGALDYLILRAGDRTAWRLVPAAIRNFVEDDARHGSVLSDTLLAYVACDLSVKLAAERLFVHPNTAHYRLAKIEDRTGCDVRRLADVQLLTIAVRLQRGPAAT
jgi:hypothetical protein